MSTLPARSSGQSAPALNNERCFRTVAGGTSGGAEPTWIITKGGSTTDSGGVVWVEVTGQEAYHAPGAWAAPHARLQNAVSSSWAPSGDTVYVAANHAETQTASWAPYFFNTGNTAQCFIICVDNSGSGHVPPQAGDQRTTATVTTTGNAGMTFTATNMYVYGITFQCAVGASLGYGIILGQSSGGSRALQRFEVVCVQTHGEYRQRLSRHRPELRRAGGVDQLQSGLLNAQTICRSRTAPSSGAAAR